PERFDLTYIGADNERHRPIMIHRVIYGSIERFFGILVEHFAGQFPLWLAPVQTGILPLNDDLLPFAQSVAARLETLGIRTEVDPRSESLNKKVRDAQLNKIPLILTCGNKEKENGTISVRTLDGQVRQGVPMAAFEQQVLDNVRRRALGLEGLLG
ncbi:MAG: threonine--tRNA ligase, partial [Desulfatitalea sp.]|nr:threonine--tRNA ligase [Desulfatitalea sp.]